MTAVCTRRRRLRRRAVRGGEDHSRIRTMGILWRLLLLVVLPGVRLKAGWWCLRGRRIRRWVGCVGGGNARRGLPIRILDFWGFVFLIFCLLFATTLMCLLSLSLSFCVMMMALYYPYFLGLFFFLFSLSFTNYGIPFLCPNDLPVQISGHLIPILIIFFSFSCMFFSFGT